MTAYPVRTRRWTRVEYERLVDVGVLGEDEPVELLGGQMIVAEPKGSRHSTSVSLTADALRAAQVHRGPVADPTADFAWRYSNIQTLWTGAWISPLCRPDVTVAVADLLP